MTIPVKCSIIIDIISVVQGRDYAMLYETWDILWNHDCNYLDNIIDLNFEEHFHRVYEFVVVCEGEIDFCIDKKDYRLSRGDAVLIMPNQFHSVSTEKHSNVLMLRFMPDFAGVFYTTYFGKIPDSNKFRMPEALEPHFSRPQNIYDQKSRVYEICGAFCRQIKSWRDAAKENDLLVKALMYIEENFKSGCTVRSAAAALGYEYTYFSKFFLKNTGITFTDYLNDCRIKYACHLISSTNHTIAYIAHECGYSTLRTFNRNFQKHTGTTPMLYKSSTNK